MANFYYLPLSLSYFTNMFALLLNLCIVYIHIYFISFKVSRVQFTTFEVLFTLNKIERNCKVTLHFSSVEQGLFIKVATSVDNY